METNMGYGNIVLASTKKGFVPNAIKYITNSQFSHSFITMPDILNIPMCMEAATGGVGFIEFDTAYENNTNEGYEIWEVNAPKEIKDAAISSVLRSLETTYGFLEFPYFIWRKINLYFGRDIKSQNNWEVNSGIICSQLCVSYLKACGLSDIFSGYGDGSIAPQDLQNIFKSFPGTFKLIQSVRL